MGKKKGKKKGLAAEPWVEDPAYAEAEAAQEYRVEQLGGDPEQPQPEPESNADDGSTLLYGAEGAAGSAAEQKLPPRPELELPWEELDAYLEAVASGSKAQQLLVRGQAGGEYTHLDSRVSTAVALAVLEITGTPLCTLPATALGGLAALKELRLPHNALLELPVSLFGAGAGLPQLQVIDLSRNRLRYLPSSVVRLPKLQVLNVASNQLSSLPEVGCLGALKTLNVTGNRLVALPEALPTTLSVLLAADNDLTSIPASVGLCSVLGELDISGNALTSLPSELSDCAKLKALRCAGERQKWSDRKLAKLLQPPVRLWTDEIISLPSLFGVIW
jgi:hypothetical protein